MGQLVYVISTGGTIEKVYSERLGQVVNTDAKIDRYLDQLRLPDLEVEEIRLMNKDSLEMTEADRDLVLATVRAKLSKPAPVVITHGTDTLVKTGLHIVKGIPDLNVAVVLTGAMTPLGFERSDGLQNLTESLLAARILPAGVWVVMHGQVIAVDQAEKSHDLATFIRKAGSVR